jgi:hypothetical protein
MIDIDMHSHRGRMGTSNAGQGLKGGLQGYRDVMSEKNPRQPEFVNDILKFNITAIEYGLTSGFGFIPAQYANLSSGFYSDAYSFTNPVGLLTNWVADQTDVDRRIFK